MKPYFQDEHVTIYHADCREILSSLTASVAVTDPPYGVNLGNHAAAVEKRPRYLSKRGYASYDDTRENFLLVVVPAIRWCVENTKRAVVFMAGSSMWDLPPANVVGGVFLPAGCGRNPWGFANFAHCLFYGVAPDLHLGAKPIGITSTDAAGATGHPCAKPLSWMKWAVSLAAQPSDTVLDPFMGSGTTLRAAKDLGIRAIGIEIEERYCEVAAKRMAQEVLPFSIQSGQKAAIDVSRETEKQQCLQGFNGYMQNYSG